MADEFMVYASFAKCGCISAVTADRAEDAKHVAKSVAAWIRSGHEVKRISDAEFKRAWDAREPKWGKCIHEKPVQTTLKST